MNELKKNHKEAARIAHKNYILKERLQKGDFREVIVKK